MRKRRVILSSIALIGVVLLATFFIPKETKPSGDTRVILEHNQETYIVPRCFEEANASNYLGDSTLEKAKELNYDPHSACTIEALESEKNNLFVHLLKEIGLLDKKWDNW